MPYYNGKHNKDELIPSFEPVPLKSRWRNKKLFLSAGIGGTAILLAGIFIFYWFILRTLPSIEGLRAFSPSVSSHVYGENNAQIGIFAVERRTPVSLVKVPKYLFQAIIAVEDARFMEHHGIDYRRIASAFVKNIIHRQIREGASTITQQLVKNLFLTPEKSIKRKLQELILAKKVEAALSKDEILELYLNQINLGHGAYGVQAASHLYFAKDVSELTLAESAFMAGLPKAPTEYSPYNNPDKAKQRQEIVLKRMVVSGYISSVDAAAAASEILKFQRLQKADDISPYFMEYIRLLLKDRGYDDDAIYTGGLNVYTSLNLDLQTAATHAVHDGLRALDKRQGFRGPVDHIEEIEDYLNKKKPRGYQPENPFGANEVFEGIVTNVDDQAALATAKGINGKIKLEDMAWARRKLTGKDLKKDIEMLPPKSTAKQILKKGDIVKLGLKKYDPVKKEFLFTLEQEPLVEGALIALDPATGAIKAMVGGYDFKKSEFNRAISAKRQPGSAFKPVIYATAIERGKSPANIILDAPIIYKDQELDKIWKPENYEGKFYGPIPMREALAHSRNLATIRLLDEIGITPVEDFARRIGLVSPFQRDLSLALGTSAVGILELTSAYGVFANQGIYAEPFAIESISDHNNNVKETHEVLTRQAISKEVAYMITNMLEEVVQTGTGIRARELGKQIAGKTGTTNDFGDAWFIGYNPRIVVGVWVGFDDRRSLGDREAGASAALPIWISFMREAFNTIPDQTFPIPEKIVYAKIDPKTGLLSSGSSADSVTEPFIKGSEPKTFSRKPSSPSDFSNIDQ